MKPLQNVPFDKIYVGMPVVFAGYTGKIAYTKISDKGELKQIVIDWESSGLSCLSSESLSGIYVDGSKM